MAVAVQPRNRIPLSLLDLSGGHDSRIGLPEISAHPEKSTALSFTESAEDLGGEIGSRRA